MKLYSYAKGLLFLVAIGVAVALFFALFFWLPSYLLILGILKLVNWLIIDVNFASLGIKLLLHGSAFILMFLFFAITALNSVLNGDVNIKR